jgi:cytochrome c oxidase subunit 1
MASVTAPVPSALHPRAAGFTKPARPIERRLGLLFATTGVALILLMGVLGLIMRLTQATVVDLSPAWFYRLMTLHGMGMITGALIAAMGALWYVLHESVPLRAGHMLASYALTVAGAAGVLVATLIGGFGAAWTFLPPLAFFPAGQWPVWSESVFFVGMMLVGSGFFVYCIDVLRQTTSTYGGLTGALGWRFLRGREPDAPPASVIAATVVAFDGLLAMSVGMTIGLGLLGRTYDTGVGFDLLVSKNLVYFFGHTSATLLIYLAAGAVYVLLPRYAGRPYEVTKVFVAGWGVALVLIVTVYSHHLYMDFVQPQWAQVVSEISSYASALPVAVITIYSLTMLVWGSRYRWTLASSLLYVGLAGWAIGGTGAVIDSIIPFNFRLHNTVWVVAHFHTYLMLTVVVWLLAFIAHLLERDAGVTSSRGARTWTIALLLIGGFGLTGTWFVEGILGIPRRYAIQPPGTAGYSLAGSIFGLMFALGVLVCVAQLASLARTAWGRRHYAFVDHMDSWTGSHYEARVSRAGGKGPAVEAAAPWAPADVPLAGRVQLCFAAAVCVVALASFFPQIVTASEASVRYHHLDHAGHFFLGLMVGLLIGSLPAVSRRLGDRSSLGLATVIAAPAAMMLVMVPRFYEPLERHPFEHALYHLAMAAFGLATGLGASRLGRVGGRLASFLSIGMVLLFAAAMKGG